MNFIKDIFGGGEVAKLIGKFIPDKNKALEFKLAFETLTEDKFNNARKHDIATFDKNDLFSNRLRSIVRPICTLIAISWYVYARANEIPLGKEDYAIIGGILAFWFGFRPFEKKR